MYCNKCGKELVEGAAFCAACGAPVANTVLPDAQTAAQPVAAQPVARQNEPAAETASAQAPSQIEESSTLTVGPEIKVKKFGSLKTEVSKAGLVALSVMPNGKKAIKEANKLHATVYADSIKAAKIAAKHKVKPQKEKKAAKEQTEQAAE